MHEDPPTWAQVIGRAVLVGELRAIIATASPLGRARLARQYETAVDQLLDSVRALGGAVRWRDVEDESLGDAWAQLHEHLDHLDTLDAGDAR